MKRNTIIGLATAFVALGIIGSCMPEQEPDSSTPAATQAAPATTQPATRQDTTQAPSKPSECVPVPATLTALIGKQFTTPIKVTGAGAVKSPDFDAVHFVTIKGDIDGAQGESYTFAVAGDDLSKPGTILAADSYAQQFTSYPKGDESKAQISTTDPSIAKARGCVA